MVPQRDLAERMAQIETQRQDVDGERRVGLEGGPGARVLSTRAWAA